MLSHTNEVSQQLARAAAGLAGAGTPAVGEVGGHLGFELVGALVSHLDAPGQKEPTPRCSAGWAKGGTALGQHHTTKRLHKNTRRPATPKAMHRPAHGSFDGKGRNPAGTAVEVAAGGESGQAQGLGPLPGYVFSSWLRNGCRGFRPVWQEQVRVLQLYSRRNAACFPVAHTLRAIAAQLENAGQFNGATKRIDKLAIWFCCVHAAMLTRLVFINQHHVLTHDVFNVAV